MVFIQQAKRCLSFVVRLAFRPRVVFFDVRRLRPHTFTNFQEIWNQRTWCKLGLTYVLGFFIYLPFQMTRFVGL